VNIAAPLSDIASATPSKVAVIAPSRFLSKRKSTQITFQELELQSNYFTKKFLCEGLKKGDKVLVFIKPSTAFSIITFALFKAGIIPVFLDPGMGKKNLLNAIKHINAQGLIAEPIVHFMKFFYRKSFASVQHSYNVREIIRDNKLNHLKKDDIYFPHEANRKEAAAILFTSGGTGIPKGVVYTHEIFIEQRSMLQKLFKLTSKDSDLPGFPLFGLFTLTMGMTSILPEMNPSKPARVDPQKIVENILEYSPTFVAGSPAIWQRVLDYCLKTHTKLPSIKSLVMFGAPVPLHIHKGYQDVLPHGQTYTPYGATECLPVSSLSGKEVLESFEQKMNQGHGTCVGKAAPGVTIKIIPISDQAIEKLEETVFLDNNTLGEICIQSATVTPEYIGMAEKTKLAKIKDGVEIWHRMGDLGYLDDEQNLWFCGRMTHRMTIGNQTIPAVPLENIVNRLEGVKRCALICVHDEPLLLVQKSDDLKSYDVDLIKKLLLQSPYKVILREISEVDHFPVDGRHNIKIDRLSLKKKYEGRA